MDGADASLGKTNSSLALDTSSKLCTIALKNGAGEIFEKNILAPRDHLRVLFSYINEVSTQAGITMNQISKIITGKGPGSFTGLRIGVTAANTLGQVLQVPVYGVSSLASIAMRAFKDGATGICCPVVDAIRGEIFAAAYEHDGRLIEIMKPDILYPDKLIERLNEMSGKIFLAGDALVNYSDQFHEKLKKFNELPKKFWYPHAASMLEMLQDDLQAKPQTIVKPFYLRVSDAERLQGKKWGQAN